MKNLNKEGIKSDKGFTMIELIIVVAIMGILAAILVPSFTQMTRKSRFNADLNTIKHVQTQIELYMAEHDGEFPTTDATKTPPTASISAADFKKTVKELVDGGYLKKTDTKNGDEQTLDLQSTNDGVTATYTVAAAGGSGATATPEKENATLTVATGKLDKIAQKVSERDKKWVNPPSTTPPTTP